MRLAIMPITALALVSSTAVAGTIRGYVIDEAGNRVAGARGSEGVRAYYRHSRVNWKHSWRFPYLADRQSLGDSSEFAPAVAAQSLLSHGVPSAAWPGRSRANAPLPAPHSPCARPKQRPSPAVRSRVHLCARDAPVCPPANRENLLLQSSTRLASTLVRLVPIALASFVARIPAEWRRCLAPNHVRPASDLLAARAAAVSVADRPDNCSSDRSPTSFSPTRSEPAPDSNARNRTRTADSPAFARQSIVLCSGHRRDGPNADAAG